MTGGKKTVVASKETHTYAQYPFMLQGFSQVGSGVITKYGQHMVPLKINKYTHGRIM